MVKTDEESIEPCFILRLPEKADDLYPWLCDDALSCGQESYGPLPISVRPLVYSLPCIPTHGQHSDLRFPPAAASLPLSQPVQRPVREHLPSRFESYVYAPANPEPVLCRRTVLPPELQRFPVLGCSRARDIAQTKSGPPAKRSPQDSVSRSVAQKS